MSTKRSQTDISQRRGYIKFDDTVDLICTVYESLSPDATPKAFHDVLLMCLPDLERLEIDEDDLFWLSAP